MTATFAAIIWVYYVVPLSSRGLEARLLLRLALAVVVFLGVLAWQVRQIVLAELPAVRAAQAVVLAVPLFLTGYAFLYLLLSRGGGGFSQQLTRTSALYFAVVVFSSIGFGDITPTTDLNRLVVMSQVLGGVVFVAVAIRVFFAASRLSLRRDQSRPPSGNSHDRDAE
jgi:voltage-gated potassium channel